MSEKIRVALLFGGRSAEHEVSLQSARNIAEALDEQKYEVSLIGIDKGGRWMLNEASNYLANADDPKLIKLNSSSDNVALLPGGAEKAALVRPSGASPVGNVDVVFPVLHGTYGEDGTIQGLLKLANVPFVGAGVLGSAVGMDKDVAKRLLRDAGIPVAPWVTGHRSRRDELDYDAIVAEFGLPLFVKPANLGSSVGVHKVTDKASFDAALDDAFQYDTKLLIEESIQGREIEFSVLGNEDPKVSIPGEIVPQAEFYSYEAKYIDAGGALLSIPADLNEAQITKGQALARKTFQTLCLEGLSRVDFFLRGEDEYIVNEVNTMPGFTKISMYPKLWEASGISYSDLLDQLISLAMARFARDNGLKTQVS